MQKKVLNTNRFADYLGKILPADVEDRHLLVLPSQWSGDIPENFPDVRIRSAAPSPVRCICLTVRVKERTVTINWPSSQYSVAEAVALQADMRTMTELAAKIEVALEHFSS